MLDTGDFHGQYLQNYSTPTGLGASVGKGWPLVPHWALTRHFMVQRTCDPQWLEHEHGVKFTEEKSIPSSLSLVHALLLSASAFFSSV